MSEKIKLFRPCNGTHGDAFTSAWCGRCERDRKWREDEVDPCEILGRTLMYDIEHPDYPQEWRYEQDGNAVCTAFVEEGSDTPRQRCEHTSDMFQEAQP